MVTELARKYSAFPLSSMSLKIFSLKYAVLFVIFMQFVINLLWTEREKVLSKSRAEFIEICNDLIQEKYHR